MNHDHLAAPGLPRRRRLAPLAAATASTTALLGTLVLMFGQASQDEWLAGTDAQLAELHRCRLATPDPGHRACVEQQLAAIRADTARPTRWAAAAPDHEAPPR